MKVLVIGKNGQLGSAFERIVLNGKRNSSKCSWIFTDRKTLDVTNSESIRKQVELHQPNVIINCSAYTNVNDCETEEGKQKSHDVNVVGNANLALICREKNIVFITFSTDYVYGDSGCCTPLKEEDSDSSIPLNVYGMHKLAMENAVGMFLKDKPYLIFRISWLWSMESVNCFVRKILDNINNGDSNVYVVNDQIGSPTWCNDLVNFIVNIVTKQKYKGKSGVYNFSNEGMCSWYDFAHAVKEVYCPHVDTTFIPVQLDYSTNVAVRPNYSVMDKTKVKRDFGIDIPWWFTSLNNSK